MCIHYTFLPRDRDRLTRAVRAASARSRVNGVVDIDRFPKEFVKELGWLIWGFGAKPVFRSLVALQEEIGLPCDLFFLEANRFEMPTTVQDVDICIDALVLFNATSIDRYIMTGEGLDNPCLVPLVPYFWVQIPWLEAQSIIYRYRQSIDLMRHTVQVDYD